MKKINAILGTNNIQLLHAFVAVIFLIATIASFEVSNGSCFIMSIIGFFYGLFNYCKSIDFNKVEE